MKFGNRTVVDALPGLRSQSDHHKQKQCGDDTDQKRDYDFHQNRSLRSSFTFAVVK